MSLHDVLQSWNYNNTWYHGSPFELTFIRKGSTITQNRKIAEVFSHKPPMVSIGDDGTVQHNGTMSGFLYSIAEEIGPADVYPHPRTTMQPALEWLTNRDLKVTLIGPVSVCEEDVLTEEEVEELRQRK